MSTTGGITLVGRLGVLLVLVAGGCLRESGDEPPSGPNPQASPSTPPLTTVTPVPIGQGPAPTPTPGSGGTPAPPGATPEPTPPSSGSCRLPPGTGSGDCPRTSPVFLGDVNGAIQSLIKDQPEIFVKRECEGCYDVVDPGAYLSGVVQNLGRRGFCALWDGEEVAVKNTNEFNEQYDILSAGNSVRSGGESYRATCRPAWF
jgi:hypothetical protein